MKHPISLVCLIPLLLALGWPPSAKAQEGNAIPVHEFTGEELTEEELLKILLPKDAALDRPRGMGVAASKPGCRLTSRGMGLAPAFKPVSEAAALRIQFAFNSAELLPASSQSLNVLGRALSDPTLGGYCFRIEGHADSIGSNGYNQRLSLQRAQAVARYLVSHFAIESNQLEILGLGEERPIADNSTEGGRNRNRRVQIVTLGVDEIP
jgi:OmpA-OmpF porin, OOP family